MQPLEVALALGHGVAVGGIDTLPNDTRDCRTDLLITISQINPRILNTFSREQSIRHLGHVLAADRSHSAGRLSERHLTGGLVGEGPRAQIDADEGAAPLGDAVEGLVGGDLGLVVLGEDALIDLADVVLPVAGGPPGGGLAARADVGYEEELGDGWECGGGVDEVRGRVAVDLEGLPCNQ